MKTLRFRTAAFALVATLAPATLRAEPARPNLETLRHDEDWSAFEPSPADSQPALDRLKHIDLDERGRSWLSLGGQLRIRGEHWSDANFGVEPDESFLLSRAMLHADLHVGPHVRLFVQARSSLATDHGLGGGPGPDQVDTLDLHNGFVELSTTLGGEFEASLRGGRQELSFGKGRLVHMGEWGNTRRSFDGAALQLRGYGWSVEPFYAVPVVVEKHAFNRPSEDARFYGAYATGSLPGSELSIDVYWLADDQAAASFNGSSGESLRHTLGARFAGDGRGFDFDLEGAAQIGTIGASDIRAFMLAAEVGHTLAPFAMTPRLFAGLEWASGDSAAGGDVGTFAAPYPDGHAAFGDLDIVGGANAIDVMLGASVRPVERLSVRLAGHALYRASDDDAFYGGNGAVVRPAGLSAARELGYELELGSHFDFSAQWGLGAGYSHFFSGEFIEATGPAKDVDALNATVVFTF